MTGAIIPTNDIVIPPTPEPQQHVRLRAADFPAAPAEPAIALIQRGDLHS